jgi:hypothetical protein
MAVAGSLSAAEDELINPNPGAGRPANRPVRRSMRGAGDRREGRRRFQVVAVSSLLAMASFLAPVAPTSADVASQGFVRVGSVPRGCNLIPAMAAVDPGLSLFLTVREISPNAGECGQTSQLGLVLDATSTRTLNTTHITLTAPTLLLANAAQEGKFALKAMTVDSLRHRLFVAYQSCDNSNPTCAPSSFGSVAARGYVSVWDLSAVQRGAHVLPSVKDVSMPLGASPNSAISPDDPTNPAVPVLVGATSSAGNPGTTTMTPIAVSYDPKSDKIEVVLSNGPFNNTISASSHGPFALYQYAAQFDLTTGGMDWAQNLSQCSNSPTEAPGNPNTPILRFDSPSGDVVAIGCLYVRSPYPLFPHLGVSAVDALAGGSMLTYLIPLDATGHPVGASATSQGISEAHIGRTHILGGVADPVGGRIYFAAAPLPDQQGVSASGATAVVFDVAHRVYVGAPTVAGAEGTAGGFALAAGADRFLSVGPDGILAGDGSASPPGQGVYYHGFSCWATNAVYDTGARRLVIIPDKVCSATDIPTGNPDANIVIYQDETSPVVHRTSPDLDSYTSQVPEAPGSTVSQFGAYGQASATRIRLIGGTTGLLDGVTAGSYSTANQAALNLNLGCPVDQVAKQACPQRDYSNREMQFGLIQTTDLNNYQASASADGLTLDSTTAQAMAGSAPVPDTGSACSDPGTAQGHAAATGDIASSVTCDLKNQVVKATSSAGPIALLFSFAVPGGQPTTLPLSVGSGASGTTVSFQTIKGLVSDTVSEAKHINAFGVTISNVSTDMNCFAHGHKGTASCTFTRNVGAITAANNQVLSNGCTQVVGPPGLDGTPVTTVDTCAQAVAALNAVRPGALIFSMPMPDQRSGFLSGSPGGYQAVGQREFYRHLEDQTLNYDSNVNVPGLEVLLVNDSINAPSRIDVQFATVEAEAHYGITPLGSFTGSGFGAGGGVAPCLPTSAAIPPTSAPVALASTGLGAKDPVTPDVALSGCGNDTGSVAPLGSENPLPQPPQPQAVVTVVGQIAQVAERFWSGLQLLIRDPGQAVLSGLLILMLLTPLLLAIRRRQLELIEETS